jgi:phospholipase D1/2
MDELPSRAAPAAQARIALLTMRRFRARSRGSALGLGTAGKLYATVDMDKARVGRTRMLDPVHSPRWNEAFRIYCAHDASNIIFTVKADNAIGATLIGRAYLPTRDVVVEQKVERWLDICDEKRQPLPGGGKIHVQLQFTDVAADHEDGWGAGVGGAGPYGGVPRTFFEQRRGNRVRLYGDAHVADGFAPRVTLAGSRLYEPRRCWEDVFQAINNARRMVYIAGWSVNTDVQLVRDPRRPSSETLGELLIRKANEGVTVLMLVWDDRTSGGARPDQAGRANGHARRAHGGLLPRHQGALRALPAEPRQGPELRADKDRSYVQDVETATMFTHHQKTVVSTAAAARGRTRRRGS